MTCDKILVIEGSEIFGLGIKTILVQNKLSDKNSIEFIRYKKELELDDTVKLAIVGQCLFDHMQFEEILEFIRSLKLSARVLLIPEIINSKLAKSLFSRKFVDGILSRNCREEEFIRAYEEVMKGDIFIGEGISLHQNNEQTVLVTKKDNPYYLLQKLTAQEKRIMEYVIEGKSSNDISQVMFRSVHTIKTHRKNMLHKLGVTNTIELIAFLDSVGFVK